MVFLTLAWIVLHDLVIGRAIATSRWFVLALVLVWLISFVLTSLHGHRLPGARKRLHARRQRIQRPKSENARPAHRRAVAVAGMLLLIMVVGAGIQVYLGVARFFNLGGPGTPTPSCRWTLDNQGTVTCVSHATFIAAGAGLQRFASGIALFFYAFILVLIADAATLTDLI